MEGAGRGGVRGMGEGAEDREGEDGVGGWGW